MDNQSFFEAFKQALVQWAAGQPDIRAALLGGSLARQVRPGDAYADCDISLFAVAESDPQLHAVFVRWLRDYALVWMIVEENYDQTRGWLVLYRGGIKVDCSITPITALQPLIDEQRLWSDQQRGFEILLDKDGVLAQLPAPRPFDPPPHTPPTQDRFVQRVENFYYGAVYVAKQIKRGNLWKVKWADQYQQTFLLEMLEWHAHATHTAPVDTYYRGDFMREWASQPTWEEVHGVFAHFDADDSWRALFAGIKLYTRLVEETAAQLRYTYPRVMIAEVTQYIQALYKG